jgi:hypothetical protein
VHSLALLVVDKISSVSILEPPIVALLLWRYVFTFDQVHSVLMDGNAEFHFILFNYYYKMICWIEETRNIVPEYSLVSFRFPLV